MEESTHMKETEIESRRDDALRRALSTPPKPKRESDKSKGKKSDAPSDDG
ncbi:MAG: hypothetical protein ACSHXI_08010 [Hoeflea sp.]